MRLSSIISNVTLPKKQKFFDRTHTSSKRRPNGWQFMGTNFVIQTIFTKKEGVIFFCVPSNSATCKSFNINKTRLYSFDRILHPLSIDHKHFFLNWLSKMKVKMLVLSERDMKDTIETGEDQIFLLIWREF